jgi:dTDP-4-dehydrorhamnose 3,5-epimerase-like enzyme
MKEIDKMDFNYFKDNHGDREVYVTFSKSNSIDTNTIFEKVKLSHYLDKMMKDIRWYFKTEDCYDFLNIIGIKKEIMDTFNKYINKDDSMYKEKNIALYDCSFFMGGKGSTTGWHCDMDDLAFLYVAEGKKRIRIVSNEYDENMYERKIFTAGAKWGEIDFKNIDYEKFPKFKEAKVNTYILEKGDCILIPKRWWHCVENLEDTIGFTYKAYRWDYYYYHVPFELLRRYWYMLKGYTIADQYQCLNYN